MPKNKHIHWTYNTERPRREYHDPRLPVARHIGWTKVLGETSYTVPEPDNYNRAVINTLAIECPFIEDQVIYKDLNKNLWATLLYVPEEQQTEFDAWLQRTSVLAHWQHKNAPKIRQRRESLA